MQKYRTGAEGGSDDESSDSDGGPGFFDGVNDNPSEEAFAAATAKGRAGRLAGGGREEERAGSGDGTGTEDPGVRAKLEAAGGGGGGAGGGGAPTVGEKRSGKEGGGKEETRDKKKAPDNFSKVDPSLPRAELAERFPLFLQAESCTVEVEAGQMLFLPAGWFHEVKRRYSTVVRERRAVSLSSPIR